MLFQKKFSPISDAITGDSKMTDIGFWSVMGEHNGVRMATGWDRLGTQADGHALLADAIAAGLGKSYWDNLTVVMQCDAAEYFSRISLEIDHNAFLELPSWGPQPQDEA
jgi:predicted butyrate kinase (DUF1464 family)